MTPRDWLTAFLTRNPFAGSRNGYTFASAVLAAKIADTVDPETGETAVVVRHLAESVGLAYLRSCLALRAMARDGWIIKRGLRGRKTYITLSLPDNLEARWQAALAARRRDEEA